MAKARVMVKKMLLIDFTAEERKEIEKAYKRHEKTENARYKFYSHKRKGDDIVDILDILTKRNIDYVTRVVLTPLLDEQFRHHCSKESIKIVTIQFHNNGSVHVLTIFEATKEYEVLRDVIEFEL